MRHSRVTRPLLASLLSGAVALIPLSLLALTELFAQPVVLSTGKADDIAMRGSGLVILSLPFLYIFATTLAFGLGLFLLRLRRATLRDFLFVALMVTLVLATLLAVMTVSFTKSSALDYLLVFAFTFALAVVSILPAAICWWLLGARGINV